MTSRVAKRSAQCSLARVCSGARDVAREGLASRVPQVRALQEGAHRRPARRGVRSVLSTLPPPSATCVALCASTPHIRTCSLELHVRDCTPYGVDRM